MNFYHTLLVLLFCTGSTLANTVTLTLQPGAAQGKDASIGHHANSSSVANLNYGNATYLESSAWSTGIGLIRLRSLLHFDLRHIPVNAEILQAELYLYHHPGHSHSGSNAGKINRITTSWDEQSVTWNNQPSISTVNEAYIPTTLSSTENIQVNVTALVQDMVNYPGSAHGFRIQQVNETSHRGMVFASSDYPDPNLHPRLVITYSEIRVLTLQPGAEGKDVMIAGRQANPIWGDEPDWFAMASSIITFRSLIEFDLSALPPDAVIVSARLSLYSNPGLPHNSSLSNACLLRRITQPWGEHTVTWNNQPATTVANEAYLPVSVSPNEDYHVDVTQLYRDIWTNPEQGHGLMIRLANESNLGASLAFCSGDYSNPARRPRLEIRYRICTSHDEVHRNYVRREQPLKAGFYHTATLQNASGQDKHTHTTYYDGLGRPIQDVQRARSPQGFDLIQPIEYDQQGRQLKDYLPYPGCSSEGGFYPDYKTGLFNFYHQTDRLPDTDDPFALKVTDNSPLNRVLEQGSPGEVFQPGGGKTRKLSERSNLANEVLYWKYNTAAHLTFGHTYYQAGSLSVSETEDEDQRKVWIYTDKAGRIVLEKRTGSTAAEYLETYYVYDDPGRLRYVIPPMATANLASVGHILFDTSSFTRQWVYHYRYDDRGRVIHKKVPGKEVQYFVYDKKDRLVLSQDGRQRPNREWIYTKYDCFDRPVISGIYIPADPWGQSDMQNLFNSLNATAGINEAPSASGPHGYTANLWPNNPARLEALTVYYYDHYDFDRNGTPDYSYLPQGLSGEASPWLNAKGLPTGSKVKVLGSADTYLWTVTFYDNKMRPVQVRSSNHLNPTAVSDVHTSVYDFSGNELRSKTLHNAGNGEIALHQRKDYDYAGRPVRSHIRVNNETEVLMAAYQYDELGRLEEKNLHSEDQGRSFLQSVDYSYNLRGALTHINNAALSNDGVHNNDDNDIFGMELYYETLSDAPGQTALYNGHISHLRWKGANTHTSLMPQGYNLEYDYGNRLTNARYVQKPSSTWQAVNGYSETGMSYDRNGNMLSLNRYSNGTLIDQLSYTYRGNRLIKVEDAVAGTAGFRNGVNNPEEYIYDVNGNMTNDFNKNLPVQYNHLNLVSKYLRMSSDIEFTYDAYGNKLTQQYRLSNGKVASAYQYVGPFLYIQSGHPCSGPSCLGSPTIQTAEGRIKPGTGGYSYQYDLKDYLGSVRMTFDKDPTTGLARIVQEDHYYAFGGKLAGRSYDFANGNRYTYTGQEYLNEVDVYDHGARMYDHQLGRWHVVDPLAELYMGYSPYNYVLNNPISYLDPTGLGVEGWYMDESGQMQFNANIHSQGDMDIFGISGTYQFEEGFWAGKDGFQSYYSENGESVQIIGALETVNLMGKREDNSNLNSLDWASGLGLGLNVGELARQGKIYEIYGRSVETVENALKNRQYVHTNGKIYKQGFRGNQYVSSKSVANSINTAKFARNLGRGMTLVGAGISLYQFGSSNQTGADYARLTGAALITGSAFIPVVGPFISVGLGVADSFGTFDGIYNSFGL